MFKNQIWSWLKAGIINATKDESSKINDTDKRTGKISFVHGHYHDRMHSIYNNFE